MSYNSKYFERKSGSLEEAILNAVNGVKSQIEEQKKVKEKLDPVGKEDGDIDNDGDQDATDKYLAKRRKAIGKAMKNELTKAQEKLPPALQKAIKAKEKKEKKEAYEIGTKEYVDHTKKVTPGQSNEEWNDQVKMMQEKNNSMRSVLAKMWGVDEGHNPFDKKEEKKYNKDKKEDKTMTGKPMTKVTVDPDMKEKKNVR